MASLYLVGCAPIVSKPLSATATDEGLIYYMPKRDVVVTLTTNIASKLPTVSVSASTPYADVSKRFVLMVEGTPTGKRSTDVMVTSNGLLTSSSAKIESEVGEIVANIATTAGSTPSLATTQTTDNCDVFPNYSTLIPVPKSNSISSIDFCGFTVTIKPLLIASLDDIETSRIIENKQVAGYFYRQDLPYQVKVISKMAAGNNTILDAIVNSPSHAPVQFIPVSKAFFADNDNLVKFDNGILTQYKEVKTSELLGLTSIPADIIAKYFDAAGKLFGFRNIDNTNKLSEINSELRLEIARQRFDSCITAIRANDTATIEKLNCGK